MKDGGGGFKEISNPVIREAIDDLPNKATCLNEASFGLRYVEEHVKSLPPGAKVLEIGSGSCVLLSHMSSVHPSLSFTGVEPIGPGFENYRASLTKLKASFRFDLFEGSYEEYEATSPGPFDLIFLVNVFEHLPSWKDFLRFAKAHLKAGGKCIILCPNYAFPYESHFGVPIIANKNVTYRIFSEYVDRFEVENSVDGLWSSLNFVRLGDVKREVAARGLALTVDHQVMDDLVARLSCDGEFARRQGLMGRLASFAHQIGLLKLFSVWPFVLWQPYMYLVISRNGSRT